MSASRDDRDLSRRFDALRRRDRESAPRFAPMWAEAARRAAGPRRHPAPARPAWVILGAAAILAAVTVGLELRSRARIVGSLSDGDAIAVARALASWEAPTDALLDSGGTRRFLSRDGSLELTSVMIPVSTAENGSERRTR